MRTGLTVTVRKVGACRIQGELGKGGMARVFRALHEPLQRQVAIKELSVEVATKHPDALARFRREAMALAGFRHQHIVTLYDFIEKNDSFYMVMELVDGPTLMELIKEGPLPPQVAAVIGLQLASALEHAHFNRIVHRDLKPSNVMVSTSGDVKLMDFGIARDQSLEALTKTGMAVGTPVYMSPEQVVGSDVDARSDIYSLGVLLYECLSGQRPFGGASAGEVFARIRDGKYTPLHKVAAVPKPLLAIVRKAMSVKREHRHADASQLRRELERWVSRWLTVSEAALLLGHLRQKERVTKSQVTERLTETEVARVERLERLTVAELPGNASRWWWLVVALLALLAGAGIGLSQRPDLRERLFERAAAPASRTFR